MNLSPRRIHRLTLMVGQQIVINSSDGYHFSDTSEYDRILILGEEWRQGIFSITCKKRRTLRNATAPNLPLNPALNRLFTRECDVRESCAPPDVIDSYPTATAIAAYSIAALLYNPRPGRGNSHPLEIDDFHGIWALRCFELRQNFFRPQLLQIQIGQDDARHDFRPLPETLNKVDHELRVGTQRDFHFTSRLLDNTNRYSLMWYCWLANLRFRMRSRSFRHSSIGSMSGSSSSP